MPKTIDPDDISKRMFMEALKAALQASDDSVMHLSTKLGLRSNCWNWVHGHMPPYAKMQAFYPKLIEIADGKK